jgi:periplasmic protein CpxP/Spy
MKKLSLIAAVALGTLVACSMAIAQEAGKDAAKKKGFSAEQRLERMSTQLNLTDDQKPKVKAVLEDSAKKMKDLAPEDRRTKGKEIRDEETKQLKAILTDEQFKKYEEMMQHSGGKKGGEKKSKKKSSE